MPMVLLVGQTHYRNNNNIKTMQGILCLCMPCHVNPVSQMSRISVLAYSFHIQIKAIDLYCVILCDVP